MTRGSSDGSKFDAVAHRRLLARDFSWPIGDMEGPMAWWSPDPRAVIEIERFHVSAPQADLQKRAVQNHLRPRFFRRDSRLSSAGDREGNTWLTTRMIKAYIRLHRMGHAHSVEAWHEDELAGGTYGVAFGGLFAAESMFYRVSNASKRGARAFGRTFKERGIRIVGHSAAHAEHGPLRCGRNPPAENILPDWPRRLKSPFVLRASISKCLFGLLADNGFVRYIHNSSQGNDISISNDICWEHLLWGKTKRSRSI